MNVTAKLFPALVVAGEKKILYVFQYESGFFLTGASIAGENLNGYF